MSQAHDLHRALLRPAIIHTLRAAGFHSTRPSVLDTLVNIAERYMLLLASTTAQHASNAHNDPIPTVTDVRMALADCGALTPADSATEEEWRELMRIPVSELQASVPKGGERRAMAEKRKRDEQDVQDIKRFRRWFEGDTHAEMRRIAGLVPDASSVTGAAGAAGGGGGGGGANLPAVGVGGGVVQAEDYLTVLKKRMHGKAGQDDSRLQGTVLGRHGAEMGEDGGGEFGEVVIEGGPVQRIRDWMPKLEDRVGKAPSTQDRRDSAAGKGKEKGVESNHVDGDLSMVEPEPEAERAAS